MRKIFKRFINTLGVLLLTGLCSNAYALTDGDTLEFVPADPQGSTNGSYLGFEVGPGFFIYTSIESFNGIIIGQEQPASGSHPGSPDGSEHPSIDVPWSFLANTGMLQTPVGSGGISVVSDDGTGVFILDFSALGFTWNGIANVPLGGDPANPADTGLATLVCSTPACATGNSYVLDYSTHVPFDDPSGLGGVLILVHLEGTVNIAPEILDLRISITEGRTQECNAEGGNTVEMTAAVIVPDGDEVDSISWSVDAVIVGEGAVITPFLNLGNHTVAALLTTKNGLSTSRATTVDINDTTRPEPIAEFILKSTGLPVTEVDSTAQVELNIGAVDICDPNPVITYSNLRKNDSVTVADGDSFVALPRGKTNILKFEESLSLSVTAGDASGNFQNKLTILNINVDTVR